MEVRHQERYGILSGGQERYEGRMSRLPALLPQDPYQRRCAASSTHKEFQFVSLSLDELLRPYIYYGYVFP